MDLHKYGYTPKGASLVLYRNKEIRKHQIFACSQWTGYTVINNAVQSTKSGGPMAAAWAVLNFIGDEGYLEIAEKKLKATRLIAQGIKGIRDLRLVAEPDMSLLAFTSDTVNVFHIIDEMNSRGWYIQPALTFDNSKENIHLSITVSNAEWVEEFLADLEQCVDKARSMESGQLAAALGAGLPEMDVSNIPDEAVAQMLGMAGLQNGLLPERTAEINEVLNILPPQLRERLLIEFVNDLFRHRE
jgi:glutamate/tyrosine decarboxylase-like PLP-dependent enzyme